MSVGIEALFTSALGLQPPWVVGDVKLDTYVLGTIGLLMVIALAVLWPLRGSEA